jgi:hypothetical protein
MKLYFNILGSGVHLAETIVTVATEQYEKLVLDVVLRAVRFFVCQPGLSIISQILASTFPYPF